MKLLKSAFFIFALLVAFVSHSQIFQADNGLTSVIPGGNASNNKVSLGGTLNNTQTAIDFGTNNSNSGLLFKKGTLNYLYIGNDGKIGIATITPTTTLDVNGTIKTTNLVITSGAGVNKILVSDANGNATWQSSSAFFSGWSLTGNSGINPSTNFIGTTDNQPLIFKTNNVEAMRISQTNGRLGIGTATPDAKLHVAGNFKLEDGTQGAGKVLTSDANGNASWQTSALSNTVWTDAGNGTIYNTILAGNIGIGTNSPGYKLDVNGAVHISGDAILAGNGTATGILFTGRDGYDQIISNVAAGMGIASLKGGITLSARNNILMSRQLRICSDNDGLDGLILQPTTINTAAREGTRTLIIGANQINTAYFDNNGNLGIGAPTPAAKLHVAGNFKLEDGTQGAGKVLTSDANGNASWQIAAATGSTVWTDAGNGNFYTTNLTGNVGIGTTSITDPAYKLFVEGAIHARKVKIDQTVWADYVFNAGYRLPTLAEVQDYINQHKHLPGVPSAAEVEKNGVDVGESQAILLKKIEELTLYAIDQNKQIESQATNMDSLNKKMEQQQRQIDELLKAIKKN